MKNSQTSGQIQPPKLTIDQLKNYLGTGLKIERVWITAYGGFDRSELEVTVLYHCRLDQIKPICYRLSDLDKFIPELGFVPIEQLLRISFPKWFIEKKGTRYEEIVTDQTPNYTKAYVKYMATMCIDFWMVDIENEKWWILQQLFQWHFWPFDQSAFDEGLVIDKLQHGKEVDNG